MCLPIFLLIGFSSFAQKAFNIENILPYSTAVKETARTRGNIKTIGFKRAKHFMTAFPDAENVQWLPIQSGTIALFTIDGKKIRADYDQEGRWLFNLRHYDETGLPANVRKQLVMTYYDYKINSVDEIETDSQTIYLVNMEGRKSYKTIMVNGDDMEIFNSFNKF